MVVTHWAAACQLGAKLGSGKMEKEAREVSSLGGCWCNPVGGGGEYIEGVTE